MAVMKLVKRAEDRDTAAVLQCLADMAKRGEVIAVALCYRTDDQAEHAAFTGLYKAHPDKAVNAAMRLSWRLTQMQDDLTGPP